jgi:hypothetical protein
MDSGRLQQTLLHCIVVYSLKRGISNPNCMPEGATELNVTSLGLVRVRVRVLVRLSLRVKKRVSWCAVARSRVRV